jgi:hypothetical protein
MPSMAHSGDTITNLDAYRCWTWRHRHPCGCLTADDCTLNDPLPLRDEDPPCRGQFGPAGRWLPCCAPTGTG